MYKVCCFAISISFGSLLMAEPLVESGRSYLSMQDQILDRLRLLKAESKSTEIQIFQIDDYCKSMTYDSEYSVTTIARMRAKRERLEEKLELLVKQRKALRSQLTEIREGLASVSEEAGFLAVDETK